MERPRTQDEQRKAEFDKRAAAAKELADAALRNIDHVLAEETEFRRELEVVRGCTMDTDEDIDRQLRLRKEMSG